MEMSFRWFGPGHDGISLQYIRQIPGVKGVVTTLYDTEPGEAWPREAVHALKEQINAAGLKVCGIESVNVHDDIKAGVPSRDQFIENYIRSLTALGEEDIHMVCYNFMPVFDWTRTDLNKPRPDGSTVMAYDQAIIDQIRPENMFDVMSGGSNGF